MHFWPIKTSDSRKRFSFYRQHYCQLKVVSPFNHGSLRTERPLQPMIIEHLTGGEMWPLFVAIVTYALNIFVSQSLLGFSTFKVVSKPMDLLNLEFLSLKEFPSTHNNYFQIIERESRIYSRYFARLQNTSSTR